ncbi:MAG: hypothetical protein II180_13300 [Proteobacteria bacterium]|nr:hypothetical protein [Pseudomonadota bacterium]
MKAHKFFLAGILLSILGTAGCEDHASENNACKEADKPADATSCNCVEGEWKCNADVSCDESEKPEGTTCDCVEGEWKCNADATCDESEKPENALSCDCAEGEWQNCDIEIEPETCEQDCERVKAGYTCDLTVLACNCNGTACADSELCLNGECTLQKGSLKLNFKGSENILFEDGSNSVTMTVGLDKAPSTDVQIAWSYDGADAGNISCKPKDNTDTIVLNADNWENGVDLTCTMNAANHYVEGDRPISLSFQVTSTDPAFQDIPDDLVTLIVHDTNEAKIIVNAEDSAMTTESGGKAKFRVKLSADPQCAVKLDVSTVNADDTAQPYGFADMKTITLDSTNWSQGIVITLVGTDDGKKINTSEHHYSLVLTPDASACEGAFATLEAISVDVINADNDSVSIVPTTNTFTVKEEGETTERVMFGLSDLPDMKTTITATIKDASICTLIDSKTGQPLSSAQVTFSTDPDDFRDQYITVKAIDDNVNTGNRPCDVMLTGNSSDNNPSTSYNGKTLTIHGTSIDNDVAAIKGFVLKKNRFCERGILCSAGNSSEIYLATKPLENVTLTFSTTRSSGSMYNTLSIKPETMTFTPENYNKPQTLTYRFEWDHIAAESDTVAFLQMNASSKDSHYDGKRITHEVTLVNADVAAINVSNPSGTILRERTPEKYETIKIKLKTIPSILLGNADGDVEIIATSGKPSRLGVSTSAHKGSAGESASLKFTPNNWDQEQTFYIFPIDNQAKDLDVSANIDIKAISKYYKEYKDLKGKSTTFTVKDNDISTTKMNIKCSGLATCNPKATTGECKVSVSSKPQNSEAISVSCSSSKVIFNNTHFKLSPDNNYTYTIKDISSAYCGNTFEGSHTSSISFNCSGEATNYYTSGTDFIDYLYNF